MNLVHTVRPLLLASLLLIVAVVGAAGERLQTTYDIVLEGGRVIDPETGFDAVRNVGIRGDRIAEISADALVGVEVIDVGGLVVAPGFIDLHSHGQTNQANEYQVHDGVTTALELESGEPELGAWLSSRSGRALINFGASVPHGSARAALMDPTTDSRYQPLPAAEFSSMLGQLDEGLQEGGLGIGIPVDYYPGATRGEIFRVYEFAAERGSPVFTHVRDGMAGIQEAIADASVTGAPLHIMHVNSMALGEIDVALDMVAAAQARGLDITTELYPYTAASTNLASALFDPGWQARFAISFEDLQWVATGERLTETSFNEYRQRGGIVIIHMMQEPWIESGLASSATMIASDGMPYAPGAHPRSAGTFSRVLGRYVRERGTLGLMEALAKMTIRPARRLEGIAPSMRLKGRMQVGGDADVTVFDPDAIIDTATFEDDLSFSEGVRYVLVNGTFVVRDGDTVPDVFPGRAVVGRYRR